MKNKKFDCVKGFKKGVVPIIDSGHGFKTVGKESAGFRNSDGQVILKENSLNEAVANKLDLMFYVNNKESHFIVNEWYDVGLNERCAREKAISRAVKSSERESIFISLHADAFRTSVPEGGRFFYHSDSGKKIAFHLTEYLQDNGYGLKLRKPMMANFKMLRGTDSPAVLFEMGFMTTESDLKVLMQNEFRNKTARLLYEGICLI